MESTVYLLTPTSSLYSLYIDSAGWDLVSVGTEPRSREPNLTADIHLGRRADEVLFIAEIDEEGVGRRVPLPDATVDFLQSHISVQRQGVDRVGAESVCASDGQHSQVS